MPGLKYKSFFFLIKYVKWVSALFLYPLRGPGLKKVQRPLIKVAKCIHARLLLEQRPSKNYQTIIKVLHISVSALLHHTQSIFSWDRFSSSPRPLPSGHFLWPKTAAEWNQWGIQHKPHTLTHWQGQSLAPPPGRIIDDWQVLYK